jgi:hypothetical protein
MDTMGDGFLQFPIKYSTYVQCLIMFVKINKKDAILSIRTATNETSSMTCFNMSALRLHSGCKTYI